MPTIAFAGAAHIHTPGFLNMLSRRPQFKVKTLWDHHAARGKKRADECKAQFVENVDAIANDAEVTGVVVCSETDRHQELVEKLAAHGKHLFVEKPLGMAATDAYAMADILERSGGKFQTGYFMRGWPVVQTLKRLVEEGFFGTVTRVRACNVHSGALDGWFDAKPNDPASDWRWMADVKQSGVGAFGDLGTHVLDVLVWIFGAIKTGTAQVDNVTARYEGCDETGEAVVRFENGVIGTIAAGWADVANPMTFQVNGTKACATVVDGKLHLVHKEKNLNAVLGDATQGWPHAFELWLDALEGKNVSLVTPREAAYRSAVMEALYAAAKTGTWQTPKKG